MKLSVVVWELV